MKKKLLTIAIPVYRRYDTLAVLLEQITKQVELNGLHSKIEILLCDDSGDDFFEREFINKYLDLNYVKYIENKKNLGLIDNILKIIQCSSSVYCCGLGDDEELLENKLIDCITLLESIEDNSNLAAIIFDSDKEKSENELLNATDAARRYFCLFGNFGHFIINVSKVLPYFDINKRNTIWPQTELVFDAAYKDDLKFCIVKDKVFVSPNHRKNTRYNTYYVLSGCYISLLDTALNIRTSIDCNEDFFMAMIDNINSRNPKLFKSLLLEYSYNDLKSDTVQTNKLVKKCFKEYRQYVFHKKIYLFPFVTFFPSCLYRVLINLLRKILRKKEIVTNANVNIKNAHNDLYVN